MYRAIKERLGYLMNTIMYMTRFTIKPLIFGAELCTLPLPPQPSTLSLKARHTTAFWWPLYSLLISPVSTHHRRARLSEEAVGWE